MTTGNTDKDAKIRTLASRCNSILHAVNSQFRELQACNDDLQHIIKFTPPGGQADHAALALSRACRQIYQFESAERETHRIVDYGIKQLAFEMEVKAECQHA